MKKKPTARRSYGFRKPKKPLRLHCLDGVTRTQHCVQVDLSVHDAAVKIAAYRDVSITYLFSTLLKDAVERDFKRTFSK